MRAWRFGWLVAGLIGTSALGEAAVGLVAEAHAEAPSDKAKKALDAALLRAERAYTAGVRALKNERYAEALSFFERTIALKGSNTNLLFNLVESTRNLKQWSRVALYGQAFMMRERGSQDALAVGKVVDEAFDKLAANGRKPGTYRFEVSPEGTQVLVDGVPVSNNALQTVRLSPGKYAMSIQREGYEPVAETLTVVPGDDPVVIARTLKAYIYEGKVRVVTDPVEGVEVYIDDVKVGVTPIAELTLETGRRYLFRFEKPGYDRWWRYVEVMRNEVVELKPVMERLNEGPRVGLSTVVDTLAP